MNIGNVASSRENNAKGNWNTMITPEKLAELMKLGALIEKDPMRHSTLYRLLFLDRWNGSGTKH